MSTGTGSTTSRAAARRLTIRTRERILRPSCAGRLAITRHGIVQQAEPQGRAAQKIGDEPLDAVKQSGWLGTTGQFGDYREWQI